MCDVCFLRAKSGSKVDEPLAYALHFFRKQYNLARAMFAGMYVCVCVCMCVCVILHTFMYVSVCVCACL